MLDASAGFAVGVALFDAVAALAGSGAPAVDAGALPVATVAAGESLSVVPPGRAHAGVIVLKATSSVIAIPFDFIPMFLDIIEVS
jgi:hypothetical protein